ncbi:MAG: DASS family sodium-coupled anion symporter [Acidobacteriota bacterium]|nr:MAG: DASS family sodium-coupled anion symporter [Acidobacteriota bacterium]
MLDTIRLEKRQKIGLILGPLLFVSILLLPLPAGMSRPALGVGATAALMAVWWITEAIPIPATALLPIAFFPALGVMSSASVTTSYANHLIYLYLGGFLIAVTIQKWNLHRRIALVTIRTVGISPNRIVLGFMLATWMLSMWISNTATTMMMLPIGIAVVGQAKAMLTREQKKAHSLSNFGTALMLGIAYSSSIGGIATLIGTPPNAILVGVIEKTYGQSIDFFTWATMAFPLSVLMLAACWFYLTRISCRSQIKHLPGGRELIVSELKKLGPTSKQEKRVLTVFVIVAGLWIARGFVSMGMVHDSTIAVAGAIALFLIPADLTKGEFLLDWRTAVKIPWDIIILFGGGFALAAGFSESGLTEWIATRLTVLQGANIVLLIAVLTLLVVFLTEMTSNSATASLILPIMAAFAEAMQVHPYGLMIAVALSASFAFMLPVATPPNAIVFSSRMITIPQMARIGFWLNLIGSVLIILIIMLWLPRVWEIDLTAFPVF